MGENARNLECVKVPELGDWDGGHRREASLARKMIFGFGHTVCEVAMRYPAEEENRFSEVWMCTSKEVSVLGMQN